MYDGLIVLLGLGSVAFFGICFVAFARDGWKSSHRQEHVLQQHKSESD